MQLYLFVDRPIQTRVDPVTRGLIEEIFQGPLLSSVGAWHYGIVKLKCQNARETGAKGFLSG